VVDLLTGGASGYRCAGPPRLPLSERTTLVQLLGVTANQFVKTTVIAILGIVFFKMLAERSNIGGLQALAARV
jgi:hypothetical protein